jgi:hypothetical protein
MSATSTSPTLSHMPPLRSNCTGHEVSYGTLGNFYNLMVRGNGRKLSRSNRWTVHHQTEQHRTNYCCNAVTRSSGWSLQCNHFPYKRRYCRQRSSKAHLHGSEYRCNPVQRSIVHTDVSRDESFHKSTNDRRDNVHSKRAPRKPGQFLPYSSQIVDIHSSR